MQKLTNNQTLKENEDDHFPEIPCTNKDNEVIYAWIEHSQKDFGYVDLTGKVWFVSARGNQSLLVAYGYNANAILVRALKK